MGTPYSPAALTQLYPLLEHAFPESAKRNMRSGILANKPGYHNTINRLRAQGRTRDYSVVEKRDKAGAKDASRGFDAKMTTADLNVVCRRLMAASLARDPRLVNNLREWFGSYTGRSVVGYSIFRRRPASSDPSHEWHFHLSLWSDVCTNKAAMLEVAEVLLGLPVGALTGTSKPKPPSSAPPKVPMPTVSLKALVAAAKQDGDRAQGGTTKGSEDDVRVVEAALLAAGLLEAEYAKDGSFGSSSVNAYAGWQRRQGWHGDDADGIPGEASLKALGARYGFKVSA